jgi:hypothetical protein
MQITPAAQQYVFRRVGDWMVFPEAHEEAEDAVPSNVAHRHRLVLLWQMLHRVHEPLVVRRQRVRQPLPQLLGDLAAAVVVAVPLVLNVLVHVAFAEPQRVADGPQHARRSGVHQAPVQLGEQPVADYDIVVDDEQRLQLRVRSEVLPRLYSQIASRGHWQSPMHGTCERERGEASG